VKRLCLKMPYDVVAPVDLARVGGEEGPDVATSVGDDPDRDVTAPIAGRGPSDPRRFRLVVCAEQKVTGSGSRPTSTRNRLSARLAAVSPVIVASGEVFFQPHIQHDK
jgi:hypothetical protein